MSNNNSDKKSIPIGLSDHISYSALSTYTDCGHKYYLTRVKNLPETPAWYLVGGSAVHEASELFDKEFPSTFTDEDVARFNPTQTFSETWARALERQIESTGVGVEGFRAGGRVSKAWPEKENSDWWMYHGPLMVKNWIDWRKGSGWSIWEPQEGLFAVELGLDYSVSDETYVKMFIDRVMVTPSGEIVVMDLKTGARTPSSDLQLAVYAAGLEDKFGIRPQYGAYWMARDGVTSQLSDLDYLSKEKIESVVLTFDRARKAGIFIPNLSNCSYCSIAQHCEWSKK